MAQAIVCDVCEKTVKATEDYYTFAVSNKSDTKSQEEKHMCPDCAKDFGRWMKERWERAHTFEAKA